MVDYFTTLNPLRENLFLFISHCPISTCWINEHHFSHHTNEDRKLNHLTVSGSRQYLNITRKKQHQLRNHWKDWCWSWSSNTLATWCEELTHWKRPWCWERLMGMAEDEMVGWHHWLGGRESEQASGVADGQGGLACCSPWGCKESDTTEQPITELNWSHHTSWINAGDDAETRESSYNH